MQKHHMKEIEYGGIMLQAIGIEENCINTKGWKMKKESLGDKYKKSLIIIRKLEEDIKALIERISKLSTLLVSMDILLGKRNVEILKLKEE